MHHFVPRDIIAAPSGTTPFKIISGGAEVDFETENFVVSNSETAILTWYNIATATINRVNAITPASKLFFNF